MVYGMRIPSASGSQILQLSHRPDLVFLCSDYSLEEGQKATLIDVFMPSVRMAGKYRSVNRMVTLPAWLNAAALERDVNFSQVLQEALKKVIFDDITG